MALFSRTKASPKSDAKGAKQAVAQPAVAPGRNLGSVIVKPRITEKAISAGERNVYTFIVRRDATKYDVRDAVKALFNVTPVKVNIVNKAPKQRVSRRIGRTITEKGMKKAYVYLKDGDSINLI
jgi:large subunit ribosomal protein L23